MLDVARPRLPFAWAALAAAWALAAPMATGAPYHTPTIDGVIARNGVDWDPADLVVDDAADDNTSRTANVRRLLCTWDQDYLYLAVTYQDYGDQEALRVYVDLDRGIGPADLSLLDEFAGNFRLPVEHGVDLVLGRQPADGATLTGPAPTARLVTSSDGATADITSEITVAQAFNTGSAAVPMDEAALPFWFNAEFALPWSAIYPDLQGGVPPYAVLKAVALIGLADPTVNGIDSAPSNAGLDGGSTPVVLSQLHASVLDADGNGAPDPAGGSVSGTATLPDDPGTAALTATARLTGFAGRDPGAPLSRVVTAAGVRTYTLPRLPAGQYAITLEAEGYLLGSTTVTLTQDQQVAGVDLTLAKATAIRGSIAFASGPGGAGTVTLLDEAATAVAVRSFTAAGGPYVFYADAGSYTVRVEADTYLPAEVAVTVAAGTDVTGVDFLLERQTQIAGTVGFDSGPGAAGTLRFLDEGGVELDFADFPAGGGPFSFFTPVGGAFTLAAAAPTYVTTEVPLAVTAGTDITGLQIVLPRAARIRGVVAFEGPAAPGRLDLYDDLSGAWRDSLSVVAEGDTFSFYLEPGRYRLQAAAAGYLPPVRVFAVGLEDQDLDSLDFIAVRADHLEIIDAAGTVAPEVRGTVSIPADDLWFLTEVNLAARDAAGRDDLYDLDGDLTGFVLSARKLDDLSPPRGVTEFFASDDRGDPAQTVDFAAGRARFWMTDTAVEVLRVYLAQPAKEPLAGRIVVAFQDPQPVAVVLTAAQDTLAADGASSVRITAQLYDSARNPSRVPDVPVAFAVTSASTGSGQFAVAAVTTNADGTAQAELSATGAGLLRITAAVTIQNRVLQVWGGELDGGEQTLAVTVLPGPVAGWDLVLPGSLSDLTSPVEVSAQLVDQFGNAVAQAGYAFTFTAEPEDLGSFAPAQAVSGTLGSAVSVFTPAGAAGLVTISGGGEGLPSQATDLHLSDLMVVPDPPSAQEPRTRQVFPPTDLTALIVDNDPQALLLDIPFVSNWGGLQLHLLFETDFDAAGAGRDPFEQPVNYGHEFKPDYAITCKYSANDYGDFRRWDKAAGRWEWYDPATDTYTTAQGYNIQNTWTAKGADRFSISIPWAPFGGRPDSLRLQAYLTQDENGVKRSAFDSAPQDSTLNLTFDYTDPQPEDWDAALGPVTLTAWSPVYRVKTDFPTPPAVTDVTVTPAEATAGGTIVLTAGVADGGDGIGDVLADLSAMGGGAQVRMYDDGRAAHGDAAAGDGLYSLLAVVPLGNPGGAQQLAVSAFDGRNLLSAAAGATLQVIPIVEPILAVSDAVGDDHGPNRPGTARMYYTYPTNIVFGPGSFDLTGLTIYETSAMVGGVSIPMIAFQVSMVDFPDPADPSTADWNPLYGDINIQKIDILIDSGPGGTTATLPSRQAAVQPWDAWDYAVIVDGWYKALVPSLGQNTIDSWRENALRTDQDILLLSDPVQDTVTALVAKSVLGDPTPQDILGWDIAVCMLSHDGDAEFGGVRWVNEARSEWQPGGGQNSDRDSNIMDLLLVPGTGHQAGLAQEEILDYESPAALARLEDGLTPVAIQMSAFEDSGPPVIDTGAGRSVVTESAPLAGAVLALAVRITDDYQVDRATFRYRSSGYAPDGWDREATMGFLGDDLWVVDILPSWLDSNLVYSPIDSSRYLEFEVQAVDAVDKISLSPVTTMRLAPDRSCRLQATDLAAQPPSLLQVDGSALAVGEGLRTELIAGHLAEAWTGGAADPDSLAAAVLLQWHLCDLPPALKGAPAVPAGRPLGVFREVALATADSLGGIREYAGDLPGTAELSLHYPQAWLPRGADEQKIGLYEYRPGAGRWVLAGGSVAASGGNVTATIARAGAYGLFLSDELAYDAGEVISGIQISPNPFSPNGDGLYDDTTISFYLDREATVTVEIYNIRGDRKRVLTETFAYAGEDPADPAPHRVPGLIWDGRDFRGDVVPYGVYVVRILTTYNQAGGTRTLRSNHSLAVIK